MYSFSRLNKWNSNVFFHIQPVQPSSDIFSSHPNPNPNKSRTAPSSAIQTRMWSKSLMRSTIGESFIIIRKILSKTFRTWNDLLLFSSYIFNLRLKFPTSSTCHHYLFRSCNWRNVYSTFCRNIINNLSM